MLGELLQEVVVVVFDSDSDCYQAQGVAAVRVVRRLQYCEGIGRVYVGHAVGHENDVVVGIGTLAARTVG